MTRQDCDRRGRESGGGGQKQLVDWGMDEGARWRRTWKEEERAGKKDLKQRGVAKQSCRF